MDVHGCFGLASVYNLDLRLFQEKVDGMYLPPTKKGKSGCPPKKESDPYENSGRDVGEIQAIKSLADERY